MTKIANGAAVSRAVSGSVLAPFCWAAEPIAMLADNDPALLVDLLKLSRVRMHLIALPLAHMETQLRPELGRLLLRGSIQEVLSRALNRGPPAGLGRRAGAHAAPRARKRKHYSEIVTIIGTRWAKRRRPTDKCAFPTRYSRGSSGLFGRCGRTTLLLTSCESVRIR